MPKQRLSPHLYKVEEADAVIDISEKHTNKIESLKIENNKCRKQVEALKQEVSEPEARIKKYPPGRGTVK